MKQSADVEQLARSVPDNGGVYLVPAFAGLGAPHWDPYARGTIVGLTRGTTAGHIARAAIESIAFRVAALSACDREHRVPGGRSPAGGARRRGDRSRGAARGRRRRGEQRAPAVPGRS